ncbi:hypothetical protein KBX73_03045 [Acetobacter persici]|uniref:virulence-associated E family protein n=1 Tax=Acetobacter persici TaxID=1076596 RepID=UPI0020CC8277|nr:virulence-associated E family protein [Acetobacter persici]MCP9318768.1 hypothetical protein [Acetobacter persici]
MDYEKQFEERNQETKRKTDVFNDYMETEVLPKLYSSDHELNQPIYSHLTAFDKMIRVITVEEAIKYETLPIYRVICGFSLLGFSEKKMDEWQKNMNELEIPYYEKYGSPLPKEPTDFIKDVYRYYNCDVNITRTVSGTNGTQECNISYLDSIFNLDNRKYKLGYKRDEIASASNIVVSDMVSDIIKNFKSTISYDSSIDDCEIQDEWDKVFHSTFKNSGHTEDYVRKSISSFIWQIKRKTFGYNVEYARMLVLYGPQGTGKSSFFTKGIFTVCDKVYFDCKNMSDFFEGKLIHAFSAPVVFFDELGKAAKADITNIKNTITEQYTNVRLFFTQQTSNIKNMNIYCGTTNKELSSQICDDTGMRRFNQLIVPENVNLALASKIDWLKIWKSINENSDIDPLQHDDSELLKNQSNLRSESMVEEYINTKKTTLRKETNLTILKEDFNLYARSMGRSSLMLKQFKNEIAEISKRLSNEWLYHDGTSDKKSHTLKYIGK